MTGEGKGGIGEGETSESGQTKVHESIRRKNVACWCPS
jgi:hypothetical protein